MSNTITKEVVSGSGVAGRNITKAAVIGSGVMGSGIAAHLANAGIPCLLLDIVPNSLTAEEEKAGLTLDHPKVRSRLAAKAVAALPKSSTAPLYSADFVSRITPGNTEDHLSQLKDADWIIEVVTERLEIKKSIFKQIEGVRKEGAIVSTNTSGISVNAMVEDCSEEFRSHFLGTHFFNPPRHMKLLEIIRALTPIRILRSSWLNSVRSALAKGLFWQRIRRISSRTGLAPTDSSLRSRRW